MNARAGKACLLAYPRSIILKLPFAAGHCSSVLGTPVLQYPNIYLMLTSSKIERMWSILLHKKLMFITKITKN